MTSKMMKTHGLAALALAGSFALAAAAPARAADVVASDKASRYIFSTAVVLHPLRAFMPRVYYLIVNMSRPGRFDLHLRPEREYRRDRRVGGPRDPQARRDRQRPR
jgi:hypothetical protein